MAPGTGIFGIAAGPDGNLWFTEFYTAGIGRVTTMGTITEFAATSGSGPNGIASGPDGNLWFTQRGAPSGTGGTGIGRCTTAGVITVFPTKTAGATPYSITRGPDGNMWFTENTANNIAKIVP